MANIVKQLWDTLTRWDNEPARKRRAPSRAKATHARTHAPTRTRTRAASPKRPTQDPVLRAQALAEKGARRTAVEDREFEQLVNRLMRNPRSSPKRWHLRRRNPSGGSELAKAERISARFHGSRAQVYELSPAERRGLPKYVVAIGDLEAVDYKPDKFSRRGHSTWRHASGDTGGLFAKKGRPLLVVDPTTMRPAIVPNRSGQRFSSARGIVG